MLWWEGCSAPGTYAGIFFGGGKTFKTTDTLFSSLFSLQTFLFSNVKSTYIGKYRLTLICSIVADGGKKTEALKVRFRLRLCS